MTAAGSNKRVRTDKIPRLIVDLECCSGWWTYSVASKMVNATPPGISWCTVQTQDFCYD